MVTYNPLVYVPLAGTSQARGRYKYKPRDVTSVVERFDVDLHRKLPDEESSYDLRQRVIHANLVEAVMIIFKAMRKNVQAQHVEDKKNRQSEKSKLLLQKGLEILAIAEELELRSKKADNFHFNANRCACDVDWYVRAMKGGSETHARLEAKIELWKEDPFSIDHDKLPGWEVHLTKPIPKIIASQNAAGEDPASIINVTDDTHRQPSTISGLNEPIDMTLSQADLAKISNLMMKYQFTEETPDNLHDFFTFLRGHTVGHGRFPQARETVAREATELSTLTRPDTSSTRFGPPAKYSMVSDSEDSEME